MADLDGPDERQTALLLAAGRTLIESLDLEELLEQLLSIAREVTGARYAALGVLDEDRAELERFIHTGFEEGRAEQIGDLPRGKGILGQLIHHPEPLRLSHISDHPRSYGFPPGHPPMNTFLGVPILVRGEAWGNLYLTEKTEGQAFSAADQESVMILAQWAGLAIENARLYEAASSRRDELERAVQAIEATSAISSALAAGTDLDHILELVVKRGRALLKARALQLYLRSGADLELVAAAGEAAGAGEKVATRGTLLGNVLETGRPARVGDGGFLPPIGLPPGGFEVDCALLVPLVFRSRTFGVLAALGREGELNPYDADSEELLQAFALHAASAVATAQSFERTLLERSILAAEEERRRWAQELHDETLQDLAGIKLTIAAARRSEDPAVLHAAIDEAADHVERSVAALRHLITELRPAELDELGIVAAMEALITRTAEVHEMRITPELNLVDGGGRGEARLSPEIESTLYRVTQEALTNVAKHAGAESVIVRLAESGTQVELEVVDNGRGFDPDAQTEGFGLIGMRERITTLGGSLEVSSSPDSGTRVGAKLPVRRRGAAMAA